MTDRHLTALGLGLAAVITAAPAPAAETPYTWGKVIDAATGTPVAGASLVEPRNGVSGTTDALGAFFVMGDVTALRVTCPGYLDRTFAFPRPSLTAGRPGSAPGAAPLSASGFLLRLERRPPPVPAVPILPNQVTLGWRPDLVSERLADAAGVAFSGAGVRPSAVWLDGAVRLGPTLLSGHYGSNWYQMQRSDTSQFFGRWQQQGTLGLGYAHQWSSRLAAVIGPAAVLQQISLFDPPAADNRSRDYLDVPSTRWAVGLQALVSAWPWQAVPVAAEARLGLYPVAWQLTDSLNLAPQGLWALQGSLGLRWYPTPIFGIDLRYLYDHWQTRAYYQGSHGMTLGGTLVF